MVQQQVDGDDIERLRGKFLFQTGHIANYNTLARIRLIQCNQCRRYIEQGPATGWKLGQDFVYEPTVASPEVKYLEVIVVHQGSNTSKFCG